MVGLTIIAFLLLFPQTEIVSQTIIDTTITGWYNSEKFRAESGYWLDLDMSSTGASALHVVGQTVGEVFRVEGSTYKYAVPISRGDVYQVQVENKAGHYEFLFIWTPDENQIIGNFYLKKKPDNFYQLLSFGVIMLVVGLVMVPTVIYKEYRARQIAKLTYECPRCGKKISIGLEKCPYCKIDLTKYWVRCKYCNKLYDSHYDRCPRCGAYEDD
jgi:RNA polymerase subunit RPABC4/transcription elongation factor Spt4